MHCSRCQGLMMKEHLLDMEGAFGEMWTTSLRCMNCGHVHGSVIDSIVGLDRRRSWYSPVVSRTIRMKRFILESSPSSDKRPDPSSMLPIGATPVFRETVY